MLSKRLKFAEEVTEHKVGYKYDNGSHKIKKIITKKGKTTWQQYTFTYKYRTCVTQSFRASYNIDAGPLKRKEREQKTPTPCPQSTATLSHTDKYTTLHVYDQVEYAS